VVSDKSQKYLREVVARAVSEPATVLAALGEPQLPDFTSCINPAS
jgi:hypothetical protein